MMEQDSSKSIGPIIGIIIIILIMILGGLYFWGQRVERTRINQLEGGETSDALSALPTQSGSDDVSSIEADLSAASFDSLGSEMNSVEAEASAQ